MTLKRILVYFDGAEKNAKIIMSTVEKVLAKYPKAFLVDATDNQLAILKRIGFEFEGEIGFQ